VVDNVNNIKPNQSKYSSIIFKNAEPYLVTTATL
jgi:hypothetical protein